MDSEAVENNPDEIYIQPFLTVLSALYQKSCNCRKNYEELDDLLDPKFHLEDCEYRINLEKINFKY